MWSISDNFWTVHLDANSKVTYSGPHGQAKTAVLFGSNWYIGGNRIMNDSLLRLLNAAQAEWDRLNREPEESFY